MKKIVARRILLLTTSFMFIALGTISFAQKSFYVIPLGKNVVGNECLTCASIYDVVEKCEAECDILHSDDARLPCYNGCGISGGVLKVNYLCPMENCP